MPIITKLSKLPSMPFDYIIVGAGSSGCVLAERLSRDGRSRVLLVEAGTENRSELLKMPRGAAKLWMNPRYFWIFPIEPQRFRPPGEAWAYGRGLGGSSAVNGTWYFRGQPRDYDSWEAMGAEGWNWAEIERCYKEMEDFREPGAHASRGVGGPMQVTAIKSPSPLNDALLAAGAQMGLRRLDDINAPGVEGIGPTQMTVDRRRRRVSAYTAFLQGAVRRPNLTILTRTSVKRVTFEERRATGVVCVQEGGDVEVRAGREVIVCAGVLQSPKLLQLSGIGGRDLLAKFGIPVVQDLPAVGQNLSEHMMLALAFRLKRIPGVNREFRGWRLWKNALRYFLFRTGVMAYGLPELSVMMSSVGDPSWPDLQLGVSPYSFAASPESKSEPGRGRTEDVPGITASGFCLRPMSRGCVAIRSTRVEDSPIVRANWFSREEDWAAALALFKTLRRFMSQPALKDYVGEETTPGAAVQTDAEIREALTWMLSPGLHGTGACRMGAGPDAVVDARLRVRGVTGLRVVDCSVMPTPISGNTNGPAMAVAWRAAELILRDRN